MGLGGKLRSDTTIEISRCIKCALRDNSLDTAITGATAEQAKYGAYLSRLQYAADNIANVATNLDQSRSRIQDADYAVETTELGAHANHRAGQHSDAGAGKPGEADSLGIATVSNMSH